MTGYTVHTGSNMKFTAGWDHVFQKARSAGKSAASTTPSRKKTASSSTAAKKKAAPRKAVAKQAKRGGRAS